MEAFRTEGLPPALSHAFLIPLHKKGDKTDPNNYRGIAIITLLSKLYAILLERRLSSALEAARLRAPGQAGFRPDHRTTDQIFVLNQRIEAARATKKPLFACFVDFSKAFDSIPRDLLWRRLEALKVPPSFLHAIQDYYSNCYYMVRTQDPQDPFTAPFASTMGVKQGCPLSPTLFGIYIDHLQEYLHRAAKGPGNGPMFSYPGWPQGAGLTRGLLLPYLLYAGMPMISRSCSLCI
jgi:hypothetical protein